MTNANLRRGNPKWDQSRRPHDISDFATTPDPTTLADPGAVVVFDAKQAAKQAAKEKDLAPYIEAALARKQYMKPLADDEIPVVRASVRQVQAAGIK